MLSARDIPVKHTTHMLLVKHIFINFMGPVRIMGSVWAPFHAFCREENFCISCRVEPLFLLQYCLHLPFNSSCHSLQSISQNRNLDSRVDKAQHRPRDGRGSLAEIPGELHFISQMGGKELLLLIKKLLWRLMKRECRMCKRIFSTLTALNLEV